MNNNKSNSENSNNFNKYVTTIGADINNSFNYHYNDILTNITSNSSYIFLSPNTVMGIENIANKYPDKFSNDSHGFNLYLLRRIITSISQIYFRKGKYFIYFDCKVRWCIICRVVSILV